MPDGQQLPGRTEYYLLMGDITGQAQAVNMYPSALCSSGSCEHFTLIRIGRLLPAECLIDHLSRFDRSAAGGVLLLPMMILDYFHMGKYLAASWANRIISSAPMAKLGAMRAAQSSLVTLACSSPI